MSIVASVKYEELAKDINKTQPCQLEELFGSAQPDEASPLTVDHHDEQPRLKEAAIDGSSLAAIYSIVGSSLRFDNKSTQNCHQSQGNS